VTRPQYHARDRRRYTYTHIDLPEWLQEAYSDETTHRLVQATDILSVASEYVNYLEPCGGWQLRGECPWCCYMSRSLCIHSPEQGQQFFHCHECEACGDVTILLMAVEKIELHEALHVMGCRQKLLPDERKKFSWKASAGALKSLLAEGHTFFVRHDDGHYRLMRRCLLCSETFPVSGGHTCAGSAEEVVP
jgi:hypothetical protein